MDISTASALSGMSKRDIRKALEGPLSTMTVFDGNRVIGFGGMAQQPTGTSLATDSGSCYTWCAWDAVFIALLLDCRTEVKAKCPSTEEAISLVFEDGSVAAAPESAAMSMVIPEKPLFKQSVADGIASFCCSVRFYSNCDVAPNTTTVLTIPEACELARLLNDWRYS